MARPTSKNIIKEIQDFEKFLNSYATKNHKKKF